MILLLCEGCRRFWYCVSAVEGGVAERDGKRNESHQEIEFGLMKGCLRRRCDECCLLALYFLLSEKILSDNSSSKGSISKIRDMHNYTFWSLLYMITDSPLNDPVS